MLTTETVMRSAPNHSSSSTTSPFADELYRFHGFRVFDSNGERVGIVDWIWTNEQSSDGTYIGLQL